jgi:trehalose-6-phosphate synthase
MVTSLHDGMNLVAKESVVARSEESRVLILSVFTGAANELGDALQVNPYDIDQMAEAIRAAMEMDPEEKQKRMKRMRRTVREHNVYRWAANLIVEVCELPGGQREDVSESPSARTPGGQCQSLGLEGRLAHSIAARIVPWVFESVVGGENRKSKNGKEFAHPV